MYKNSKGKMVNSYLLGIKGEKELIAKGWHVVIAKNIYETEQELHDRLVNAGYKKVRIWRRATMVRGLHDIFAMVK